jgi:hypothetical protein
MELIYSCLGTFDLDNERWEGRIRFLSDVQPYEFEVSARGSSFHLLIGRHSYGNYLCIPDWRIGTDIARLEDSFWNLERLCEVGLSIADACSIADALAELSTYISL